MQCWIDVSVHWYSEGQTQRENIYSFMVGGKTTFKMCRENCQLWSWKETAFIYLVGYAQPSSFKLGHYPDKHKVCNPFAKLSKLAEKYIYIFCKRPRNEL